MSRPPKVRLEGWLLKKKSKDKAALFKSDNQRWFRIQEIEGSDLGELALCYYGSQKEKEAKGWIYLKDITAIHDERRTFTIVSSARTMILEAQSAAEHTLWLQALSNYCPFLNGGEPKTKSRSNSLRPDKDEEGKSSHHLAKEEGSSIRSNHSEVSSLRAEAKGSAGAGAPQLTSLFSRYAQGESNSFYMNAHTPPGSGPPLSAHSLHPLNPTLASSSEDMDYGEPDHHGIDTIDNHSHANHSVSSSSAGDRALRASREDHRIKGAYRAGTGDSTTSRLHKFISKDGSGNGPSNQHHHHGSNHSSADNSRRGSEDGDNSTRRADDEDDLESMTLPDSMNRATLRARHEYAAPKPKGANEIRSFDSTLSVTAVLQAEQEGRDLPGIEEGKHEERDKRDGGGRRPIGYTSDSDEDGRDPPSPNPASELGPTKNRAIPPRPKGGAPMPPPSNAPPRRARDALAEASEASQRAARRSIDEVLFKKSADDAASEADAKSVSPTNRNANNGDFGNGNDSSDEDFDLKAEMKKYHNSDGVGGGPSADAKSSARPPKFPQPNGKPPQPMTNPSYSRPPNISGGAGNPGYRSGTPPRAAANPGTAVDQNFVTDDWDEGTEESPKHNKKRNSNSGNSHPNPAGVQADENWLNEDFDN